ncbi:MAG: dTDP-4-dehydrorhamnose reductase [Robiginitalea sp.]
MKRVLVTGAGGQLGKSIQDLAPEYESMEFFFMEKTELDITNRDKVMEKFRQVQPDYCINCAAYTEVDQAEKTPQPAYAVNVKGVENLVHACAETGTILIHISTDYVFDGKKKEGYLPEDKPNPINVYGKTKLEGERVIQQSLERYFIVRTSWLYSKKYAPNFYLAILEKAKKGEKLTVTDAQRGCPTDAANLARYLLEIVKSGREDYGISHFTDGEVMSWYGFATNILKEYGFWEVIELVKGENYHTFAERPANSILK